MSGPGHIAAAEIVADPEGSPVSDPPPEARAEAEAPPLTNADATGGAVLVPQPPAVRACLIVLAGEVLAVDLRQAREVVVLDCYTVVPGAPSSLVGVTNLRGAILPIVDIGALLGLPPRSVGPGTKALVVEAGSTQVAVAIDEVPGLESFQDLAAVEDAAGTPGGSLLMGLLLRGDERLRLLDVSRILDRLRTGTHGGGATGGVNLPPAPAAAASGG